MTESDAPQGTEKRSTAGLVVAILVLAALVAMLLLVRGPEDQERSGATAPVATITVRA